MRRIALVLLCLFLVRTSSAQQLTDLMRMAQSPNELYRGMALGGGMTFFDGKPFFLVHIAPQVQFGNWGVGLDGNIRISPEGKLRSEDFDETYDYLRWLNYVSYGVRGSDLYARVGGLDHATIGNGVIVSDYSNNTSYDERKVGLTGRVNFGGVGIEGLTSDLFRKGLIGLRPFVRPFAFTPLKDVWLLKDVEIGTTGVFDFDTNATRLIPNREPYVTHMRSLVDSTVDSVIVHSDSIRYSTPFTTFGLDVSTMLWRDTNMEGRAYVDYVNFQHFNDGVIFGLRTSFRLGKSILLDLRGERSLFRNQFLPNYYNTFYERDRYDDQARPQDYITKLTLLSDSTGGNGNGSRVGGFLSLARSFQLQASYLHLDNLPGKDWMEITAAFPDLGSQLFASATYTRKNIIGLNDAFALDERSLLYARASMKVYNWLILSVISRWTFSKDETGHVQTASMFEPKADVVFSF
jgi:hypothetical protein